VDERRDERVGAVPSSTFHPQLIEVAVRGALSRTMPAMKQREIECAR
jgi:hypothetical protein